MSRKLLCAVAPAILAFFLATPAAGAAGILPPNNPPQNISPNPNFYPPSTACSTWGQAAYDESYSCLDAVIAAIDLARAQEGVGPMVLPSNFLSLPPYEQLFVLTNLERVDRGLPPFIGLTSTLDQVAAEGASTDQDPPLPPPPGYSWQSAGSILAAGYPSPAAAVYAWMYQDGYGGANADCTSPSSTSCWEHRDIILSSYDCNPCTAGSATSLSASLSPSYAEIFVGDNSGTTYSYVATWSSLDSNLFPAPSVSSVSPAAAVQGSSTTVTVTGSNFSNTLYVLVGSTPITQVSFTSTQVSFTLPSNLPAGTYDVRVVTLGGMSPETSSDRIGVAPVPAAPASVTATPGIDDVAVTWSAVAGTSMPVSSYTVTMYSGNTALASQTVPASQTYAVFTNVGVGATVSFSVTASNGYFSSSPAQSSTVTTGSTSPVIAGIFPEAVPVQGSVGVSIVGANLSSEHSVLFGSVPSSSCTVVSDGQLNCVAPPQQSPGQYQVQVNTSSASAFATISYLGAYYYVPVTPTRIADTRAGSSFPYSGQTLGAGSTLKVQVASVGPVPASAGAAVLNVTVTDTTANGGYLTIYPDGSSRPSTSDLNWNAGQTVANLVTVPLGSDGAIDVYNAYGQADVIIDVEGYYAPSQADTVVPLSPVRVADTRASSGYQDAGQTLGAGSVITVNFSSVSQLPANATGVLLNLTVTDTSGSGSYLTVWPAGSSMPTASVINWQPGWTRANQVYVPLGTNESIEIYNAAGSVDVIVDLTGYIAPAGTAGGLVFTPVGPLRLCDTRLSSSASDPCGGLTMGAGGLVPLQPVAQGAVPASAQALAANVTVTDTTQWSYLTVYPYAAAMPSASNLNWLPGWTIPNGVAVPLGSDQAVSFENAYGQADLIVDLQGFFWQP